MRPTVVSTRQLTRRNPAGVTPVWRPAAQGNATRSGSGNESLALSGGPISAKISLDMDSYFAYLGGMNALDEDWTILVDLFPPNWQRIARLSGAVERLRGFDSVNELLRVLLMHVGCGYSLRETAVRAKAAGLAEISDVTLLNRLRQAEGWLQHLCQALLEESGVRWRGAQPRRRLRAVDGTVIKEPGPTGSHWRLHYSLLLPELTCDYLAITATKGGNTAEQLGRFPVVAGDVILADRGYCHPSAVAQVCRQGADVIVRLNSSVPLYDVQTTSGSSCWRNCGNCGPPAAFANGRSGCTTAINVWRDACV